jgi:hypothetical protein
VIYNTYSAQAFHRTFTLEGTSPLKHQTITILDTHPVVLTTIQEGYNIAIDWPEGQPEVRKILDTHPSPLFIINDIRALKLSVDQLIMAANHGGRGEDPLWRHPNALGVYFITTSKAIEIAAAGMHSAAFGNIDVRVFHTVEDALQNIDRTMGR